MGAYPALLPNNGFGEYRCREGWDERVTRDCRRLISISQMPAGLTADLVVPWFLSNCDSGFAFRLPNHECSLEDYRDDRDDRDDRAVVRNGSVSRLFAPALVGVLQPSAGADKTAK